MRGTIAQNSPHFAESGFRYGDQGRHRRGSAGITPSQPEIPLTAGSNPEHQRHTFERPPNELKMRPAGFWVFQQAFARCKLGFAAHMTKPHVPISLAPFKQLKNRPSRPNHHSEPVKHDSAVLRSCGHRVHHSRQFSQKTHNLKKKKQSNERMPRDIL